jgi:hypothetical protein
MYAAASFNVTSFLPFSGWIGSSKARPQSAMMQPRRAGVCAAMIAHGAEHPRLQISKGHVVGKAASIDLSVVVTARIAAVDEHVVAPVASHIRERNRLIVKQQVWDRPGHSPSNCGTERVSKSSYSLRLKRPAPPCGSRMFISRRENLRNSTAHPA